MNRGKRCWITIILHEIEIQENLLKSVVLTGIREILIKEVPVPEIENSTDILLKTLAVGVCGSDIHYYKKGRIGDQVVVYPFIVGHECVAVVEKVGSDVSRVKPGEIVVVDPAISCGECSQCLMGREHTCLNQKFLGSPGQTEGCLSEFLVIPEKNCYPVPYEMSIEQSTLVEPLSIGYYTLQFLKDRKIDSIGILGVGPIGLSVLLAASIRGVQKIFVTDILDYRLKIAQEQGTFWLGNPEKIDVVESIRSKCPDLLDVVIECCGKQEALDQAIEILKPGGMLLIVGIPEVDRISFNISKIRRKEITIQNVRRQNQCIQPVIALVKNKRWLPDFMVTHQFYFTESKKVFDLVADYQDGVMKALIRFD